MVQDVEVTNEGHMLEGKGFKYVALIGSERDHVFAIEKGEGFFIDCLACRKNG